MTTRCVLFVHRDRHVDFADVPYPYVKIVERMVRSCRVGHAPHFRYACFISRAYRRFSLGPADINATPVEVYGPKCDRDGHAPADYREWPVKAEGRTWRLRHEYIVYVEPKLAKRAPI